MQRFRLRRRQNVKSAEVLSRIWGQEFLFASPDAPGVERCQIPQGKSFPLLAAALQNMFLASGFPLKPSWSDCPDSATIRSEGRSGEKARRTVGTLTSAVWRDSLASGIENDSQNFYRFIVR